MTALYRKGHFTVSWNLKCLAAALALMISAIIMPAFFTEQKFQIYKFIYQALERQDTGILLEAAFRLIVLSTVRSTPNYLGIMMVMEAIQIMWDQKKIPFVKIPVCFFLHVGIYYMIDYIYGIRLDVGAFALLVFLCIELLNRFSFRLENKLILIFLFLLAIQGLDVIPSMTGFGFGRGEISMDIKMTTQVLGCRRLLTCFSLLLFSSFAITTLLMGLLAREQRQVICAHQQAKQDEIRLYEARMKNLEMRSFFEIQNLVHDLKSPLTAIQGLSELTESQLQNKKLKEYQRRIVCACERMNRMISEILYQDRKSFITTDHLIQMTLSYMAANFMASCIRVDNRCPGTQIYVNSIRMSRALVNLLENACKAISPETGTIQVTVSETKDGTVWEILDNGIGMSSEKIDAIWNRGYSDSGSTGLGLGFVQQVVDLHRGTIQMESELGEYTRVVIQLPKERNEADGKAYSVD